MKLALAIFLSSLALSYAGYVLDEGCLEHEDMIISAMKGAFDFAQAALDMFNSPSKDANIAQAQRDLISLIFSDTLQNETSKKRVTDRYTAALKYNANNGDPVLWDDDEFPELTSDEIIFFCDDDRLEVRGNEVYDTIFHGLSPKDEYYNECFHPAGDTTKGQVAVYTSRQTLTNRATIIQLCPWFIDEWATAKYKTLGDLGIGGALALATEVFVSKENPQQKRESAMDIVSLYDAALLHELTHAVAVGAPPPTKDISWEGNRPIAWKTAIGLSSEGNLENAHSYAFCGLGARMISPTIKGAIAQTPKKDGSIENLIRAGNADNQVRLERRGSAKGMLPTPTDNTHTTFTATDLSAYPTVTPVGDDFGSASDLEAQESLLSAIEADTTASRVTWSPDETSSTATATSTSAEEPDC